MIRRNILITYILCSSIFNFAINSLHCANTSVCETSKFNSNMSNIRLCTMNDIPNVINFTAMLNENHTATGLIKVEYVPPKMDCQYRISLLVNSLLDEATCKSQEFQQDNYLNIFKIHTAEKNICAFLEINNSLNYNLATSNYICQENVVLWFQNVFTGCYILRFHTDNNEFILRGQSFLKTDYQHNGIVRPEFQCSFYTMSTTNVSKDTAHVMMSFSAITSALAFIIEMTWIPVSYKTEQKACTLYSLPPIYAWNINMENNTLINNNCSRNIIQTGTGNFLKNLECNFAVETPPESEYCFTIHLIDDRCQKQTACTWMQRCAKVLENPLDLGYSNNVQTDNLNTSEYIMFPLIVIAILIIIIFGAAYLSHYLRKQGYSCLNLIAHKDSFVTVIRTKLDEFAINEKNELKSGEQDNIINKDIVLLYGKGSPLFMALMSDLREILAKFCQCTVHDLYVGNAWNAVAKSGCSAWFIDILKSGCRVIWIDTPITRNLVQQRPNHRTWLKQNCRNNEIHQLNTSDFRDAALSSLLYIAKNNMNNTSLQYNNHFIVRLKGMETVNGRDDPFNELSPYVRYLLPQHIDELCTHLCIPKQKDFKKDINKADLLHNYLINME
ncbi:uncharacterized protein [Prorops nasuta]|uniref:uncharacterized protein isoform X1 n=1 Tax=Prorops nasuta TaxID=863751 RepID=UPI0034CD101D